jgi:superfamily I DNA/RNA helicase
MQRLLAASQERQCSVFSAMRHTDVQAGFSAKTREAIQSFLLLMEHKRAQLHSGESFSLSAWAEQMFQQIGYVDELRRSEKDPQTAENRVRNLKELLLDLEHEENTHLPSHERLSLFLEELMLDKDREEEDKESNGVTLITMHSCKGLEFPRVYIVGLEDGLLPHTRSKEEGTIDEERRLFYVAITRARQTLSLSYCAGRKRYGQLMPCHRSRFLSELPEELVEDAAQKSKQPVPPSAGKTLFSAMREVVK